MTWGVLVLFGVFAGFALLRVPISVSMLGSGFVYLLATGKDPGIVTDQVMNSLYGSYILLAVPMFILAANIMTVAGISERLFRAADAVVGWLPGGLGHVTVTTSLVFSSMSGSALADAAGPNLIALRMMRDVGQFRAGFAAALAAAAATIAPIIPPSIPLVLYALNSGTSVGALFLGGIVPGLLMGILLMVGIVVVARRTNLPRRPRLPLPDILRTLRGAIVPMTIPVVLLGGIWSGIFTPTEAAAVAALYSLLIGTLVYRAITPAILWQTLTGSMKVSATIMLMIGGAFLMSYAITSERLDRSIAALVTDWDLTVWAYLLVVNAVFLLLGCVLDTGTLILVVVPMLLPSVAALGIDPVHFGVVITINIMIGMITPPFGMLLFALAKLGDVPLRSMMSEVWPFVGLLILALLLVTYFPATVLWLPHFFGFG